MEPGIIFNAPEEQDTIRRKSGQIDVVKAEFISADTLSWEELFEGYDKLYAVTYSSGMDFICDLLKKFEYAEIIFGFDKVISYGLKEIMAYQLKTVECLREKASKNKLELLSRIDNDSLRLLVAREHLSHEKLYLLEARDGRKRVIMGSANMSYAAFSGINRENITYMDGSKAFDWYLGCFEQLRENSTDNITTEAFLIADDCDHFEEIPIAQTVRREKSPALVIEPQTTMREDVQFTLAVKNLANKIAPFMPKVDKEGKILLSSEHIKQTRRRLMEADKKEKDRCREYPQLVVDVENQTVTLNEQMLDLHPREQDIAQDVALFMEYMNGYEKFHGDASSMQKRYFEFANWFFATPFLARMRNTAVQYDQPLLPYPVFGLIYGQSTAGKTSFLETLLKMMIGEKKKIAAPDFTRSKIAYLKRTVKGAPIIVDDLTQGRFKQHAIETIKYDDFGTAECLDHYPAVVISANEDIRAIPQEVVRRAIVCRVQASLKNTEIMKNSIVRRIQRNIGTAFYREYLRRMLEKVPEILGPVDIKSKHQQ